MLAYAVRRLCWAVALCLTLSLVTFIVFYVIPNAKTRFRDVWVGAALTGALWRLAFDGFSWYIRHNTRLSLIHGSISAVVVGVYSLRRVSAQLAVRFAGLLAEIRAPALAAAGMALGTHAVLFGKLAFEKMRLWTIGGQRLVAVRRQPGPATRTRDVSG